MPFNEYKARVKSLSTPMAKKDHLNYARQAAVDVASSLYNLGSAARKGGFSVVIAGKSACSVVEDIYKCKFVGHELRDRGEVDRLRKRNIMAPVGVTRLAEGTALGIKLFTKSKGLF